MAVDTAAKRASCVDVWYGSARTPPYPPDGTIAASDRLGVWGYSGIAADPPTPITPVTPVAPPFNTLAINSIIARGHNKRSIRERIEDAGGTMEGSGGASDGGGEL